MEGPSKMATMGGRLQAPRRGPIKSWELEAFRYVYICAESVNHTLLKHRALSGAAMRIMKACASVIGAVLMTFSVAATSRASNASSPSDRALVERGSYLARAGDCEACHTKPGGAPYAGGEAINSPFGALYAPNLTPDAVHGIGAWSDNDFYRAMHEGVGRQGQNLYPAFPYQWFTEVTRDDVLAIRAFLKTVPPSSEPSKPNRLMFPFDIRAGLGPWDALSLHPGEFKPDPSKSDAWNRGAYLVEGLGHCGDCHTPKGLAMEPENSKAFSGGSIDHWYAPNITSDPAEGIGRWSEGGLVKYFKTGTDPGNGVVVGPMAQVVHDSLAHLTDSDLQAIAAYVKSIPPLKATSPTGPAAKLGLMLRVRTSIFNIAASAISWTAGAGRTRCQRSRG